MELFTPDFYLEDLDLWLELTTLKQNLVTEKNRKLRLLRKLYPEINIKLLYKRDYHRILARYGFGPLARDEAPRIEHVLFSTNQVRDRVAELGRQISDDYRRRAPVLVGVLRGGLCFLADLMREVSLPVSVDFLSISTPGADNQGVRITKELDTSIEGKDVILVEDVVDTGMSLGYIISYLKTKKPASVEVCALLDKKIRRIADVPRPRLPGTVPQPPLHRRPQARGGGRERRPAVARVSDPARVASPPLASRVLANGAEVYFHANILWWCVLEYDEL